MIKKLKLFLIFSTLLISGVEASEDFKDKILYLNQNKVYSESIFGKNLEKMFRNESKKLKEQNRQLTKELEIEEQRLTNEREGMPLDEFKILAQSFNARVEKVRKEQKEKSDILKYNLEEERKYFFNAVYPLLLEFVSKTNATGILDSSVVIVGNSKLDVTNKVILIINNKLPSVTPLKLKRSD
jgi:Skp family chaperone for outer membrane proteins